MFATTTSHVMMFIIFYYGATFDFSSLQNHYLILNPFTYLCMLHAAVDMLVYFILLFILFLIYVIMIIASPLLFYLNVSQLCLETRHSFCFGSLIFAKDRIGI